nr:MAG TPA: hypothetical protein [Caudoviricetes sp.]
MARAKNEEFNQIKGGGLAKAARSVKFIIKGIKQNGKSKERRV